MVTLLLHLRHMYLSMELFPIPAGACTVMMDGILTTVAGTQVSYTRTANFHNQIAVKNTSNRGSNKNPHLPRLSLPALVYKTI